MPAVVAELHVVRAGDVGQRRPPGEGSRPAHGPVHRPIGQIRNVAVGGASPRALLVHPDHVLCRVARRVLRPPLRDERSIASFEEQPLGRGRRPCDLLDTVPRRRPPIAGCFWSAGSGQAEQPNRSNERIVRLLAATILIVDIDRAGTRTLLVPEEVEFVATGRLPRQPRRPYRPTLGALRLLGGVGNVEPLRVVARIEVWVHSWNGPVLPLLTERRVVPEPVSLDGTADAGGEVPLLDERARSRQAGESQGLAVIAADPCLRHEREERRSLDGVAARSRHDADLRTADGRLAHATSRRQCDLLGIADIGDVGGDAGAAT